MVDYYQNNQGYLLSLKPQNYFSITLIIGLMFIGFIIFSCLYKITDYQDSNLIITCEEKCSYYLYSSLNDIKQMQKIKKIIIEKSSYPVAIESIGALEYDEVYQSNYQLLKLNINLPKKYQINNLYLPVKIKIKEEKLIRKIWKLLF